MSFETNSFSAPKDLASLNEAFKVSNVVPDVQDVGVPIDMKPDAANNAIYVEPELEEQMSGVDAYLNNPGNTSILGECLAQGMKIGSDTVGDIAGKLNNNHQPQQIVASINNGQQMDVTDTAHKFKPLTPELTPNTPGYS